MRNNLLRAAGLAAAVALLAGCGAAAAGTPAAPKPAVTVTVTVTVTATAKPTATAKSTATAKPTATPPTAAPAVALPAAAPVQQLVNAEAVVTQYYQDITDQNYAAAWALGGRYLSGGTGYASWAAGYATTASISLGTFSSFGSDQVAVSLAALQNDGSIYTYQGTYTVQNGLIVSANIVQTG
jgi:hypothetical protein